MRINHRVRGHDHAGTTLSRAVANDDVPQLDTGALLDSHATSSHGRVAGDGGAGEHQILNVRHERTSAVTASRVV